MLFNTDPLLLFVRALCLLTTIPIHESAHAWAADRLGDPTAKYQGRLTLNPMAHFNPMGFLSMILFGIGWAEPVPINAYNFRDRKKGMALSAARGPASNLLVATASLVLYKTFVYTSVLFGSNSVMNVICTVFRYMCTINISLAVFNLLPVPPFDGSRIFNYFLPDKYYFKVMEYERYIFIAIFVILYTGILSGPLSIVYSFIYKMLYYLTYPVDIIFRFLIIH